MIGENINIKNNHWTKYFSPQQRSHMCMSLYSLIYIYLQRHSQFSYVKKTDFCYLNCIICFSTFFMWINDLRHSFFTSFFAQCYLEKFSVYLTSLSWSHFHLFFSISFLLLPTDLNINSDDIFTLTVLDVQIQCQKLNSAKSSNYYRAILFTKCILSSKYAL